MPSDTNSSWYAINNISHLDSPALVVYVDRVKQNIARAKGMIGDVQRLRPHVKTHKSPGVTRLLLEAGIQKFKCATIAEAEMLAQCGAPDVLLAYQPVGPKGDRLITLIKRFPATSFSCLIDDRIAATALSAQAAAAGVELTLFIDLNVGMNRTGLPPDENAVDLYAFCHTLPNIKPVGLHAYDGHIGDTDVEVRTKKCAAAFKPVFRLRDDLVRAGFPRLIMVAGGSPTFPIHAANHDVECSPGTFVYWDAGYAQRFPDQPFEPAALVITRIVSLPGAKTVCADLGHKSVSAENNLANRVYFLNAPELRVVSQSEEHLLLQTDSNHSYKIGDVLYGLPYHICPTCALYESAATVENNVASGAWDITARDRKLQF